MNVSNEDLLLFYYSHGIISASDVVETSKEDLMTKILNKVHKFKIQPPKGLGQRWTTYVPDETKKDKRRKVAKSSEKELEEYLLSFYAEVDRAEKLTFSTVFDRWVEYKKQFIAASNNRKSLTQTTITRYRRDYKNHISHMGFVNVPISKLTPAMIEKDFIELIKDERLSESMVSNILGYLSSCLRHAYTERWIPENLGDFLHKDLILAQSTVTDDKSDDERTLQISEMESLLSAVLAQQKKHPEYLPNYGIELAIYTGMRVGEISALHWSDIRDGYIYIDHSEHRVDYEDHSELVIGPPKYLKHRRFPITPAIQNVFDKIRALGIVNDGDFIFGKNLSEKYTAHDISCAASRRGEEAGIEYSVSIHRIRRTVSSLLRAKYPAALVASLLGHTETTNDRHYFYDNSDDMAKAMAVNDLYPFVPKDLFQTKEKETLQPQGFLQPVQYSERGIRTLDTAGMNRVL